MATQTLTQLHRVFFRRWDKTLNDGAGGWDVFALEPDDLGQDTQMTFNFAPRKMSRASSVGTTETPIPGTFDTLTASITFIADTWRILGKALRNWNAATYAGATEAEGNIIIGAEGNYCAGNEYLDIIMTGICDDGSSTDVEFTRCLPSLDDDIELGGTDAAEITLALNPVIYNAVTHAGDGYPAYTGRLGVESLTEKTRLNVVTGKYDPVTATPTNPEESA